MFVNLGRVWIQSLSAPVVGVTFGGDRTSFGLDLYLILIVINIDLTLPWYRKGK